jgi:hypothetical protein
MCSAHDYMGAFTLVVRTTHGRASRRTSPTPSVSLPANQRSIEIAPIFYAMPVDHVGIAASGEVNIHRILMTKYNDFSFASSTLTTALLNNVGEVNRNILRTTYLNLKPYMFTSRQMVDTMLTQHGVATGDDISKLRDPLSQAMTSLSDLTKHMAGFLLASQSLNWSGQGEKPYRYFQMFLETVGFSSIGQSLTTYYAQYPTILNLSVDTLFPFLEKMKDP